MAIIVIIFIHHINYKKSSFYVKICNVFLIIFAYRPLRFINMILIINIFENNILNLKKFRNMFLINSVLYKLIMNFMPFK